MERNFKKRLGQMIRGYRKMAGLTLVELSERANIDYSTLCELENGRRMPNIYTIKKLVSALNLSGEFLEELLHIIPIDLNADCDLENLL